MKVFGTVTITYNVEIDVESIDPRDISIEESDELIKKAIEDKYKVYAKGDVFVEGFRS
ncbi:hypothetical protein ACS2Q5_26270 [Bacillus cereus group sp. Bce022]|uniref:hypothetical protein n=1 Tax=Bacillus cereus group TaxID=86661 RepID=UPI0015C51959|nr:hypothetical protein [Bacillus thuringiensis]MEC2963994.1 hypothetical protein [Bacillus cereus]